MKTKTIKWIIFWVIIGLWILGAVGLGIHTSGITPPDGSTVTIETAKLVFLWIGGLGVILPTYLNVWQSIENNQKLEQDRHFRRVENTIEMIRQ